MAVDFVRHTVVGHEQYGRVAIQRTRNLLDLWKPQLYLTKASGNKHGLDRRLGLVLLFSILYLYVEMAIEIGGLIYQMTTIDIRIIGNDLFMHKDRQRRGRGGQVEEK